MRLGIGQTLLGLATLSMPARAPGDASDLRPPAPAGRHQIELAIDGRTIPVILLATADEPPEAGHPLVVSLHGQSVDGARECDHNWTLQPRIVIACPTEPSAPWRNVWGERVALETAALLLRRFRLDPDRVFVSGASTGGIGAWRIALRRPDRFAGVIPRAGMPPLVNDEELANLLPMGAFVVHGAHDRTIVPDADRRVAERLHELGGDVVYRELDGAHSAFPAESRAIAQWMAKRRRDPAPRSFRYALPRNLGPVPDRVHWLELGGRMGLPLAVEASVVRATGRVELRLAEGYVEHVRVLLDDRLVDPARPVVVAINGEERFRGMIAPADSSQRERLVAATADQGVGFDRAIALDLPVPEAREERAPTRRREHPPRRRRRPRRRPVHR